MPTRVDIGNGYIAEFPDGMSKDDIKSALLKNPLTAKTGAPAEPNQPLRTGNPMETQAHGPAPTLAQEAQSFAEGAGQGAFNVGGIVGSRINPDYEAERAARAEQTPISSTLGYLTGAGLGGGALARGVGAVGRGIAGVLGQPVQAVAENAGLARRAATVVGLGAAGGGLQAGSEGQDVTTGAAAGGLTAPLLGVPAGKAAVGTARAASRVVSAPARAAAATRLLKSRLNLTTDQLDNALSNFTAQYGREASVSDVLDLESKGMLQDFANKSKNRAFGAEVSREAERRAIVEPKATTGNTGQASDTSSITTLRGEAMDKAMAPIKSSLVQLPQNINPKLQRAIADNVRANADPAAERALAQGKISIQTLDNVRQNLSKKAAAEPGLNYDVLSRQLEGLGTRAEPRYGAALDAFRKDSNAADAFAYGRRGGKQTDVADPALKASLASPEGKQAYAAGIAEQRAAQNLSDIAPSTVKPREGMTKEQIAHLGVAAAKPNPWSVYHLAVAIPGIKASDDVLRLAARYLTDPSMAAQGVALMRRAGANDAAITRLLAAASGTAAGDTVNQLQ